MKRTLLLLFLTLSMASSCDWKNEWNPSQWDNGGGFGPADIGDPVSGDGQSSVDTSVDTTIVAYNGGTADDSADDVVGTDENVFWEKSSFSETVSVTFSEGDVTVESANSSILYKKEGAHAVLDFATNDVSGVNIVVRGKSSDGSLKIYGSKKFKLTLNGLDLTSSKGPAINDQCHKRVFVHLTEGTTNRLTDCAEYGDDIYSAASDEDRKGCFFAEGNVILSGGGTLVVAGRHNHAICTDGSFYMRPGVTVVITETADNGLHVKGDTDDAVGVRIAGGLLYANISSAAGKAIKCDGDVDVSGGKLTLYTSGDATYDTEEKDTSSADAIKADGNISITGGTVEAKSTGTAGKGFNADGNIVIGVSDGTGPTLNVTTTGAAYGSSSGNGGGMNPGGGMGGWGGQGGGSSSSASSKPKAIKADGTITVYGGKIHIETAQTEAEGLESKSSVDNSIVVNGGDIYIKAKDDCINSAGQIVFKGGRVFAYSTGNDAVDSNYGRNASVLVDGGLLIAHGTTSPEEGIDADSNSKITFKSGEVFSSGGIQSSSGSPSCGQPTVLISGYKLSSGYFVLTDSDKKVIMAVYVPRAVSQCYSYVTSPSIKSGSNYCYGVTSAAPSSYTSAWENYYFTGGTASVSGSFSAPSGFSTVK